MPYPPLATDQDMNNPADLDAVKTMLRPVKPNLHTLWSSEDQWNKAFAANDFDMGLTWSGTSVRNGGLPVKLVVPKEGAIGWLDQYKVFFLQPYMWQVGLWSFQIAVATTLLCAVFGFLSALALARSGLGRMRAVFLILILLPFWTNGLIRVFSWTIVIRQGGFMDALVQMVWPGTPSLGSLNTRAAIVLGLVHGYIPYMVLTCYIALSTIDDAIIEAAAALGARWWTIQGKILIPMAAPGLVAGSVLIFVPVVGAFMEPRILGGPAGVTLGTVIEDNFTQAFNWPQGAAISFILLAVVLAIFATFSGVLRRNAQI